MIQDEISVLRKELLLKNNLLEQRATIEQIEVNSEAIKEDDSELAWSLATVMTTLAIIMLFIICCLCCYIRRTKA